MRTLRIGIVATAVAAMMTVAGVTASGAATTTEVLRELTVKTWFGGNEGPGGSVGNVKLVPGPGIPPLGTGSAQLTVDSTGRASLGTNEFAGTRLDAITDLEFAGYVVGGTTNQLVIGFDVDYDSTDASTAYQGRLVFIPGTPPPADAWRNLNTFTDGTWYGSQLPASSMCGQANTCTWAQVLATFPNAGIRNDSIARGAFLARLGGPISGGATAYVDDIRFATAANTTVIDFEPGGSITPSVGPMGTNVNIDAFLFKPGTKVKGFYYSSTKKKVTLCKATANANGEATCNGTIPTTASKAGPAGAHRIRIYGRKGGAKVEYNPDFVLTP